MAKQLAIPTPEAFRFDPTIVPKQKCKTCAYRTPSATEEMGIAYYVERPQAHRCHERNRCFCLGSFEQAQELERLVRARIAAQSGRICAERP